MYDVIQNTMETLLNFFFIYASISNHYLLYSKELRFAGVLVQKSLSENACPVIKPLFNDELNHLQISPGDDNMKHIRQRFSRSTSFLAMVSLFILYGCDSDSSSHENLVCPDDAPKCGDVCCPYKCRKGVCAFPGEIELTPQNEDDCSDAGLTFCDGKCVSLQSDPMHCGDCDTICSGEETCRKGECVFGCADGLTLMDKGYCVDTNSDSEHCGADDVSCGDSMYCNNGQCECMNRRYDCDGKASNGCESIVKCEYLCEAGKKTCGLNFCCEENESCCGTSCCQEGTTCCDGKTCIDLQSDPHHCGSCKEECSAREKCEAGKCVENNIACETEGQIACWGTCIDVMSDANNCGSCDYACDESIQCVEGKCQIVCENDLQICGSECADFNTSPKHCGNCDTQCAGNQTCVDGVCTDTSDISCEAEEVNKDLCWGTCVDTQTDVNHCGKCGQTCEKDQNCVSGACVDPQAASDCSADQKMCFGACKDILTDTENCGDCLNNCGENHTCIAGRCEAICTETQIKCDGACFDPKTSNKHCGACDNACGFGMECREIDGGTGACQCDAGHFNCDGDPANGCESTSACACTPGQKQACWRGTTETRGKGACRDGEQTCDASGKFWGPCTGGTYPSSVTCDIKGKYIGGDQNCNGIPDENEECKTKCELLLSESTYIGCEYWAAYTENEDVNGNYAVIISNMGEEDATVTVYKYNNNTVADTRVVKKGTVETIVLGKRGEGMISGTTIKAAGFRIVSSAPITAYQFNPLRQDAVWNDALLLLPKNVYGKRYFNIIGSGSTYIAIQATAPGETKVTVKPTKDTRSGGSVGAIKANQSKTFTLKQFDVFQLSSKSDLTGTEVTGDKPFVAIGGCKSCYNAHRFTDDVYDHYSEQLFPFQSWGKEYAIVGFKKQGGERDQWRILSAQDAQLTITPEITNLGKKIGGSNKINIKAGVPYDIVTKDNFHMSSTKPILVAGFLGDEDTDKDPSYTLVVPVQQFRNDYSFMIPADYDENYISIIAQKNISSVKIYKTAGGNDSLIKEIKKADFKAISGTDYVFYRHNMGTAHAAYKLIADKPIGVQSYGYTMSSSYAYPLGLNLINLNGTN